MRSALSRSFVSLQGAQRSAFSALLKRRLQEVIPERQSHLKDIKKKYGDKEIGTVTVDQAIGGMRNIFGLFYDTSLLDAKTVYHH